MPTDDREHPGKLGNVPSEEVADEQFGRRSDAAAQRPRTDAGPGRRQRSGPDAPLPSARGVSGHAQRN